MPDHEILTIEEVARYLRISERTVYDWANKGSIPCGKLGTTWRFKREEVEKWVDDKLSGNVAPAPAQNIAIADVLIPSRIVHIDSENKRDALEEVSACLGHAPEITQPDELAKEIFIREELMSTGIGFNVAVPHVRLNTITNIVMAVGISRNPILDYESLDEQPVRIICMLAARQEQHAQYLKTLGLISNVLKNTTVRESLIETQDANSAYLVLTQ
ncbi:MAG: PTS fructose transporter subunit IIA [Candidatus Hydrogenedentota bacterium]|nr:MAG: PTS fructose transporter subunit IIA [Candidatus Hydrogenedentota bacterium]